MYACVHTCTTAIVHPMHFNMALHFYFVGCNVDTICATILQVATDRCPDMEDMVQSVANKNGRALLLFSKCHGKFNTQQKFTDEMLVELRTFNALAQQ